MKRSIERLLLIDDDADLRKLLIKRFLHTELVVDEAAGVAEAVKKLHANPYDIIILDLVMYPDSGYKLFELLKSDPRLKWIPLIVLSGSHDVHDKVKCLELGADDYVTKPFQFTELNARVHRLLARSRQFEQFAFRDALTGAYNRRYFDNQLTVELQRVRRIPAAMTLALLDIDRFKSINDTFGHSIGDQVLQGLAGLMRANLRQTDLLARYGGEEFVVLLLGTGEQEALEVMDRMLEQVRSQPLVYADNERISVTYSAGIAEWEPGLDEKEWIGRADHLLYEAKRAGRNKVLAWRSIAND